MQPVPCNHCGYNFMRTTIDPEAIRLCNGCAEREKQRTVKLKQQDDLVGIVVKCPQSDYKEIEEFCTNEGIDFSRYFLELYYASKAAIEISKEYKEKGSPFEKEEVVEEKIVLKPTKGKKK